MRNYEISTSNYRYEKKFFITELSKYEVENNVKLHHAIFSEIYYQRFVNNIYFDSFGMNNYNDNIEGISDRIKIRIRWYGDLFGNILNPVLEFKIKNGELGKKITVPINAINFAKKTNICDILKSNIGLAEKLAINFNQLVPTLLNRYSRKYYQSYDKKYRITIDNEQSFYLLNNTNNVFLNRCEDNVSVILELKYNQNSCFNAHFITSAFPFRVTKSSKYVRGIHMMSNVEL
jgi:hypothetical protein